MSMILLLIFKELIHRASIGSRLHKYSKYSEPIFGIIARWVIYEKINLDMEGILETPYFTPFVHHFSHLLCLFVDQNSCNPYFFVSVLIDLPEGSQCLGTMLSFWNLDGYLIVCFKLNRITWYSMLCSDEANAIYA